ncbi:hypothetical protein K2P97_06975 [bacterium]|nr:hypothetical protein [bacterium]
MKLKYFISFIITVSFLGQYSFAQMVRPAQPQYETCNNIESDDGNGTKTSVPDVACQQRNGLKSRDYNAAVDAYNRGTQIITTDNGSMKEPAKPQYETCNQTQEEYGGYDYACVSRNQAKEREYNIQMSGYNQAKADEAKAKAEATTAEQKALAEQQQQQSAKAAMEEAQQKNKKGSQIYQLASMACGIASAVYAAKFAASCAGAGATCQYPLLAKSIAFAIFSGLAAKQASSHDSVAHSACQSANRVSTNPADCGAAPPTYDPSTYPSNQVNGITGIFDPNTGKCISTPEKCSGITQALPPGTNIKDAIKGLASFASSKSPPFKVNPDGTISKNGKKFGPDSFKSEKDMIAAGIPAADAKSFMADLNKFKSGADSLNAKAALSKENETLSGSFGDMGGSGNVAKANDNGANGAANGGGKTIDGASRDPASSAEGLVKDFNGELIGVAGDDIFKMMNRRYKLKTAQDSFIGP